MTVSSKYSPVFYPGNGVTTSFPFPYKFYLSSDLVVELVTISTGLSTIQTISVDYTVTGGNGAAGSVIFNTPPSSLVRVVITYQPNFLQSKDFVDGDKLFANDIENALDQTILAVQSIDAKVDRTLRFPNSDAVTSIDVLPAAEARANSLLSFEADGTPAAVQLSSLGGSLNVVLSSPQDGDALLYNAGSWNNRSVLASLGSNIASAGTVALGVANSDFVTITGTTTITSFGTPGAFSRRHVWVVFSGVLTLTHNATSLILPGGANITTAAGDVAECVHLTGGNWRVVNYRRSNGQPIVGINSILPSQTGQVGNYLTTNGTVSSWAPTDVKGSDIASSATTDIGAANASFVHVTGTTTITSFGISPAGVRRIIRFAGALTLTHNATSLILPGAANITTAANDTATFISEGSGNWRCVQYERASGLALVPGLLYSSTQASTSGTSIDFTGISTGARRIAVMLASVSTTGASVLRIRFGSGSIQTSGYLSSAGSIIINGTVAANEATNGFTVGTNLNVTCLYTFCLQNNSTNTWIGELGMRTPGRAWCGGGEVALSGAIDRVSVTTDSGSDNFTAGEITVEAYVI
jgi:hypothetical protein